jgi:hypothetical protein
LRTSSQIAAAFELFFLTNGEHTAMPQDGSQQAVNYQRIGKVNTKEGFDKRQQNYV